MSTIFVFLQNFDILTSTTLSSLTSPSLSTTPSFETVLTTSSTTTSTTTTSVWPLRAESEEVTSASTVVFEIISHVGDVLSATTEQVVEDHLGEADGRPRDLLIGEDSGRRDLLIAIICLAAILLLVLGGIGYFFYRVWGILICF